MPVLQILSSGFQTTVQDLGRFGFAHLGVSPGGAADTFAFRLGNLLVQNFANAAALEMTLVGGTFLFECESFIALTGAECEATLDEVAIPNCSSLRVKPGQTLRCGAMKNGARTYLCIHGGIAVAPVMNSSATHLQTRMGGMHGRALKKGDALLLSPLPPSARLQPRRLSSSTQNYLLEKNLLRITTGAQADYFSPSTFAVLTSSSYLVTESSNRVGLRLRGAALACPEHREMITEGISCGAVQVPSDGQPILLFVEHPTTGGYPKIAHVIAADLPRVGQLRPRDEVRFQLVSIEEAREFYLTQEEFVQALVF